MFTFRSSSLSKFFSTLIAVLFLVDTVAPAAHAQLAMNPAVIAPGIVFTPVTMKGVTIYPDNPFKFDFIIDQGETHLSDAEFKQESDKLIRYFLASLTVPDDQTWVNLSPYEKNRIIPDALGKTAMGRDMLMQDYLLKQLTASMMSPEGEVGKKFWERVYQKTREQFGTTDLPMNTFNKIWIIPSEAFVYEHAKGAFVVESHLKVMLEEDYVALKHNENNPKNGVGVSSDKLEQMSEVSKRIIREVMIPEIEREVNEGKTFANLRQIYNSMILATWYKQALKQSILGKMFADKNKVNGIALGKDEANMKEEIYQQYLDAFKKGAYDAIKEDYDPTTQEIVTHKYFSGGFDKASLATNLKAADAATLGTEKVRTAVEDTHGQVVTIDIEGQDGRFNTSGLASRSASAEIDYYYDEDQYEGELSWVGLGDPRLKNFRIFTRQNASGTMDLLFIQNPVVFSKNPFTTRKQFVKGVSPERVRAIDRRLRQVANNRQKNIIDFEAEWNFRAFRFNFWNIFEEVQREAEQMGAFRPVDADKDERTMRGVRRFEEMTIMSEFYRVLRWQLEDMTQPLTFFVEDYREMLRLTDGEVQSVVKGLEHAGLITTKTIDGKEMIQLSDDYFQALKKNPAKLQRVMEEVMGRANDLWSVDLIRYFGWRFEKERGSPYAEVLSELKAALPTIQPADGAMIVEDIDDAARLFNVWPETITRSVERSIQGKKWKESLIRRTNLSEEKIDDILEKRGLWKASFFAFDQIFNPKSSRNVFADLSLSIYVATNSKVFLGVNELQRMLYQSISWEKLLSELKMAISTARQMKKTPNSQKDGERLEEEKIGMRLIESGVFKGIKEEADSAMGVDLSQKLANNRGVFIAVLKSFAQVEVEDDPSSGAYKVNEVFILDGKKTEALAYVRMNLRSPNPQVFLTAQAVWAKMYGNGIITKKEFESSRNALVFIERLKNLIGNIDPRRVWGSALEGKTFMPVEFRISEANYIQTLEHSQALVEKFSGKESLTAEEVIDFSHRLDVILSYSRIFSEYTLKTQVNDTTPGRLQRLLVSMKSEALFSISDAAMVATYPEASQASNFLNSAQLWVMRKTAAHRDLERAEKHLSQNVRRLSSIDKTRFFWENFGDRGYVRFLEIDTRAGSFSLSEEKGYGIHKINDKHFIFFLGNVVLSVVQEDDNFAINFMPETTARALVADSAMVAGPRGGIRARTREGQRNRAGDVWRRRAEVRKRNELNSEYIDLLAKKYLLEQDLQIPTNNPASIQAELDQVGRRIAEIDALRADAAMMNEEVKKAIENISRSFRLKTQEKVTVEIFLDGGLDQREAQLQLMSFGREANEANLILQAASKELQSADAAMATADIEGRLITQLEKAKKAAKRENERGKINGASSDVNKLTRQLDRQVPGWRERYPDLQDAAMNAPGGIDFNPAAMNLKKQNNGQGVETLPEFQLPDNLMNVEYLTPVIIEMKPIVNLPLILGLKTEGSDKLASSSTL